MTVINIIIGVLAVTLIVSSVVLFMFDNKNDKLISHKSKK